MKITTNHAFTLALLLVALTAPAFAADGVKVREVEDFSAVGHQADKQRMPILLMFSAQYCGFCERLEEDFLKPMLRSGDYKDKVLIRKLRIDSLEKVRDFNGEEISPAAMADRYGVSVTPTVVFINGEGVELAPKRIGLTTPAFYGGYLDDAIDQALNILRRNKPLRVKLSTLGE